MSEQKYIQSFVQNFWKYWLIALILGLILGWAVANRMQPTYNGSVSFTLVNNPTQTNGSFYTYDGYYNEQAAVQARNNLMAWLMSPRTVSDIYKRATIDLPQKSAEDLARTFKPNEGPETNVLDVSFSTSSPDEARRLGTALTEQAKSSFQAAQTTLQTSDPLVLTVAPAKTLIMLGTALAVTFAALFVSLLAHYFTLDN